MDSTGSKQYVINDLLLLPYATEVVEYLQSEISFITYSTLFVWGGVVRRVLAFPQSLGSWSSIWGMKV